MTRLFTLVSVLSIRVQYQNSTSVKNVKYFSEEKGECATNTTLKIFNVGVNGSILDIGGSIVISWPDGRILPRSRYHKRRLAVN